MLIVEDGTGLSNSESFGSVAEADTYHTNMGNTAWAGSSTVKEVAMRQAAQYLIVRWNRRWRGQKLLLTQALPWPRFNVQDNDGNYLTTNVIPQKLKESQFELALRALSEDIMPDVVAAGNLQAESVTVGPISVSETYSGTSAAKAYTRPDGLVSELVMASGGFVERG